ncbi:MAG: methylenetetrahydrofolate reductase [bacterium]
MPSFRESLRRKLQRKQFVITVELDPPKGADAAAVVAAAKALRGMADAVNIADSPMANLRMSPIALAHIVQRHVRMETIFHLTCRDRNVTGLQAELLGAAALGVRSILALTGDKPERGDHPWATGVFDVDSVGLVRLARSLNRGFDLAGKTLNRGTDFLIGVAANPAAADLAAEAERLAAKAAAGADFVQTQPIYELARLEAFLAAIRPVNIPVLAGVLPLKSLKNAQYLHDHVPGINIPAPVMARMRQGGRTAGIAVAREFIAAARGLVSGIHLMPVNNDLALAAAVLAGLRSSPAVAAAPAVSVSSR